MLKGDCSGHTWAQRMPSAPRPADHNLARAGAFGRRHGLELGADAAGMNRAAGRAPGPEGLGDWSGRGGPRPRHGSSRRAGSRTAWLGTARSGRIPAQRSRRRTAARVPGSSACQHSGDRLPAGQGRPGRRGAARRRRRQPPTRPRTERHETPGARPARLC